MGPKTEFFTIENSNHINALQHIDVGGGVYIGFRISPKVFAEAGIVKNDYSVKFNIPLLVSGEEEIAYQNTVYPVFTSYQLGILGGYETRINEDWLVYGKGGFHLFLGRNLDRTGNVSTTQYLENGEPVKLTWYANEFETGNIIFRGDVGLYRNISENLAMDFFLSGRISNLPVNSVKLTLETNSINEQNIQIKNRAAGVGLNIGVKYKIRNFE
jgi:hypothetical protein